jgi:hypothetical protein
MVGGGDTDHMMVPAGWTLKKNIHNFRVIVVSAEEE